MKKLLMQKRGQVGLDVIKTVFVSLLSLAIIAVAVMIVLGALAASITGGTAADNNTDLIVNNITAATSTLFGNTGSWLALLAVAVIVAIIVIVIVYVKRVEGRGGGL